jgi:hypothetical protein
MNEIGRPANIGTVVAVRGSVVDVRFEAQLPPIYSLLRTGQDGRIRIEVLLQIDAHTVRGIGLTATQGLARGGYRRAVAGAGRQGHSRAHVRRVRQCHRWRRGPRAGGNAHGASRPAAAGGAHDAIGDL